MEISNPGWIAPLEVVDAMIADATITGGKLADQTLTPLQIQPLGRGVGFTSTATWTCPYDGVYMISGVGGGGGSGGAAGNVAGDSSSAGRPGGSGIWAWQAVTLVGGETYTVTIGAGGTAGVGGADTPTAGSTGGAGGDTTIADGGGNILQTWLGGFGGYGGQMLSGASLAEQVGGFGAGVSGGQPAPLSASGDVGVTGWFARSYGSGGGSPSGNNAVAAASAGAAGSAGWEGMVIIRW